VKHFIASCSHKPRCHRPCLSIAVEHTMKRERVSSRGRIHRAGGTRTRRPIQKPWSILTLRLSMTSRLERRSGPWETTSPPTGAACVEKSVCWEGRLPRIVVLQSDSRLGGRSATSAACRRGWHPQAIMTVADSGHPPGHYGQVECHFRAARTVTFSSRLGPYGSGPMITVRAGRFLKSLCMKRCEQPHLFKPLGAEGSNRLSSCEFFYVSRLSMGGTWRRLREQLGQPSNQHIIMAITFKSASSQGTIR